VISVSGPPRAAVEIIREIDDPATGDRWFLEQDSQHPGGPGRMVLVAQGKALPPARAFSEDAGMGLDTRTPAKLIRAGDHLIVEEHTSLVDAVLKRLHWPRPALAELFASASRLAGAW
jgi:hypothetical protein